MKKNVLYIFSNGRVAAIDKKTGEITWEVKLKDYGGGSMSYAVGQISVENDHIYIGVSGMLFCLSAKDGSLKWKNELKGWGYNFLSIANVGNDANAAAINAASSANAAIGVTTTT